MEKLQSKKIWDKSIKYFMLGYLPLGILLGIVTPDDILGHPWAHAFTSFMASWLPFVAEVGRRTPVPATQFIAAVMNCVAIVTTILFMIVSTNYYFWEGVEQIRARTKKQLIIEGFCTLLILAMVIIAFFMLPIGDPPGRKDRVMIGSKLGMGFSGSIFAACWLLLGMVYYSISSVIAFLLEEYQKRNKEF